MTEEVKTDLDTLDVMRIMELIPHRYPMLLIDRLVDIVPGESAVGIKNVTINEPFFQGHFPERPIMPGVLIVEAMAQAAATLVVHTLGEEAEGKGATSAGRGCATASSGALAAPQPSEPRLGRTCLARMGGGGAQAL